MPIVVVDTNFLISSCALKLDVRGELAGLLGDFGLVVSRGVRRELEGLARGKGKSGNEAKRALAVLESLGAKVEDDNGNVDNWVVNYCSKNRAIACTNDRELVKRLKAAGSRVACIKNKSKIDYC